MIKVEINSLAALQKLLEGETEMGISVQDTVVEELLRMNVKNIKSKRLQNAFEEVLNTTMLDRGYYGSRLRTEPRKAVKEYMLNMIPKLAKEAFELRELQDNLFKSAKNAAEKLERDIDKMSLDNIIEHKIDTMIEKKLEAKMKQIFK